MAIDTINLEAGMPSTAQALGHLSAQLCMKKAQRVKAVKLIHGYGSSGRGGSIRRAVHEELQKRQKAGQIKLFVKGEEVSPFEEVARRALMLVPALSSDRDFARCNHGITIVVL